MKPRAAVVTTGIYCRPGCGARPRAENVLQFPIAAAAEAAGYRACLRCRPYRSAQLVPATAPELVCRAVQLILDGALDKGTEATLGSRLGISARHLRRLFTAHLGVTPDGLARSSRAHFARRLLDDTDLSITQVAFAAGYGSLRQFNRVCHEVFRASPRELRARRRQSDRLVADGGLPLRLPYEGPLDWDALLLFFAEHAVPVVEHVYDRVYRRTIVLEGDHGVLELFPSRENELTLVAHLPHWEELLHVVQRARHIANLDLDLEEPLRALSADPTLGPLVKAGPGRRPPGTWDPFETGVQTIVRQHGDAKRAQRLLRELVSAFGKPVRGLDKLGLTHTFPMPESLASADLSTIGLNEPEAKPIRAFSAAIADGSIRLDRSVGLDELVDSLLALGGVDRHTAHQIALRLGEPDAFPLPSDAGDAGCWRPWRAIAATYLWRAGAGERAA